MSKRFYLKRPGSLLWGDLYSVSDIREAVEKNAVQRNWLASRDTIECLSVGEVLDNAPEEERSVENSLVFIWDGAVQHGPFTFDQLGHLWRNGQIRADAQYAVEGGGSWNSILEISNTLSRDKAAEDLIRQQGETNSLVWRILWAIIVIFVLIPLIYYITH